jgi:hypothetical protein
MSNIIMSEVTDLSKNEMIEQYKKNKINQIREGLIGVVCRQTELTEEESKKMLEKHEYNVKNVLNEYFNIKPKEEKKTTTNQLFYGEMRDMLDTSARNFRKEQDKNRIINEQIEKIKQAQKQ